MRCFITDGSAPGISEGIDKIYQNSIVDMSVLLNFYYETIQRENSIGYEGRNRDCKTLRYRQGNINYDTQLPTIPSQRPMATSNWKYLRV